MALFNEILEGGLNFGLQRRRIRIVEINQALVSRVFRFFPIGKFFDDLTINSFRFLSVAKLSLGVSYKEHRFRFCFVR